MSKVVHPWMPEFVITHTLNGTPAIEEVGRKTAIALFPGDKREANANARLVLRALNSHNALLTAARLAETQLRIISCPYEEDKIAIEVLALAITKAEETPDEQESTT